MNRFGHIGMVAILGLAVMLQIGCEDEEVDSVSEFSGTLNGTWSGSGYSGTFTITIMDDGIITGSYSGDDEGAIVGFVDTSSAVTITAVGSNDFVLWTGRLKSKDGEVSSGSGKWVNNETGTSGTWSGSD
ncbi:MAG: hypothetical protein JXN60_02825 [Lentisphaerae bacterium]|nr:hypothetical protein [Lentisphaerota bacterium]